jgi:hypothetical protein
VQQRGGWKGMPTTWYPQARWAAWAPLQVKFDRSQLPPQSKTHPGLKFSQTSSLAGQPAATLGSDTVRMTSPQSASAGARDSLKVLSDGGNRATP